MFWADGSSYTGEFKNNQICGKGTYVDSKGRTYEGTFEDGIIKRSTETTAEDEPENGDNN